MDWKLVSSAITILLPLMLVLALVPVLVMIERRLSARIQNRVGPILVGPQGALQPLADAVKFIFKEDFIPAAADKLLYRLAPAMVFIPAGLALAAIPLGIVAFPGCGFRILAVFPTDLGILFVLAATSLGVHGLSLAGWSSNNKYGQMGGVRASAQLISYEAPMFIAALAVIMCAGSTSFVDIVAYQQKHTWLIFTQPIAFIVFFVCAFAETNRHPFDLPEAEPELVGGYHTEFGGMRFAVFFLGEYAAMINQCAVTTLFFLGGWTLPFFPEAHYALGGWVSPIIFVAKVFALLVIMIWVRWTLPRFRYDQLMSLGWKRLTPIAMANLAITAIILVAKSK